MASPYTSAASVCFTWHSASSLAPDPNLLSDRRSVTTLAQARQVISAEVTDANLRQRLLQLAGSSSEAWAGCEARDVVGVLMQELAQRDKENSTGESLTDDAKSSSTAPCGLPRSGDRISALTPVYSQMA